MTGVPAVRHGDRFSCRTDAEMTNQPGGTPRPDSARDDPATTSATVVRLLDKGTVKAWTAQLDTTDAAMPGADPAARGLIV